MMPKKRGLRHRHERGLAATKSSSDRQAGPSIARRGGRGADRYVTKPFDDELLAGARAPGWTPERGRRRTANNHMDIDLKRR
jgi:DNA-binding response OmpR family regulator